jgi:hypothetical protein
LALGGILLKKAVNTILNIALYGFIIYLSVRFKFWPYLLFAPFFIAIMLFYSFSLERVVAWFRRFWHGFGGKQCNHHNWDLYTTVFVDTIREEGPGRGRLIGEVKLKTYLCTKCGEKKQETVDEIWQEF